MAPFQHAELGSFLDHWSSNPKCYHYTMTPCLHEVLLIDSLMHTIQKWSEALYNSCSKCCKIFKACLIILQASYIKKLRVQCDCFSFVKCSLFAFVNSEFKKHSVYRRIKYLYIFIFHLDNFRQSFRKKTMLLR